MVDRRLPRFVTGRECRTGIVQRWPEFLRTDFPRHHSSLAHTGPGIPIELWRRQSRQKSAGTRHRMGNSQIRRECPAPKLFVALNRHESPGSLVANLTYRFANLTAGKVLWLRRRLKERHAVARAPGTDVAA